MRLTNESKLMSFRGFKLRTTPPKTKTTKNKNKQTNKTNKLTKQQQQINKTKSWDASGLARFYSYRSTIPQS